MSDEMHQTPQQYSYVETDSELDYESEDLDSASYGHGYDSGNDMVSDRPDGAMQGAPDVDNRKKGISNRTKGIITLVLVGAYLLWPVDIVPDVAVGLGQIDDAIVFAMGVTTILMRLRGPKK